MGETRVARLAATMVRFVAVCLAADLEMKLAIQMAARLICPQIFEFLDLQPQWQNGVLGLMQLITLSHINQALTRRFI